MKKKRCKICGDEGATKCTREANCLNIPLSAELESKVLEKTFEFGNETFQERVKRVNELMADVKFKHEVVSAMIERKVFKRKDVVFDWIKSLSDTWEDGSGLVVKYK